MKKNEHLQMPEVGMSIMCLSHGRKVLEVGAQSERESVVK